MEGTPKNRIDKKNGHGFVGINQEIRVWGFIGNFRKSARAATILNWPRLELHHRSGLWGYPPSCLKKRVPALPPAFLLTRRTFAAIASAVSLAPGCDPRVPPLPPAPQVHAGAVAMPSRTFRFTFTSATRTSAAIGVRERMQTVVA
jgi:hypothetical protein